MTIKEKLDVYLKAESELISEANGQFSEEDCPLKDNHYILSEQIFGPGCWNWDCGFCGKHFEE